MVADLPEGENPFADWSACIADALTRLMSQSPRPTAIYCSCDAVARYVYEHLAAMNLRIPSDVSVVGNDDDPALDWLTPGLTSVHQSFVEMGQEAMELLRRRISDPLRTVEIKNHPVQLVKRDSVARLDSSHP